MPHRGVARPRSPTPRTSTQGDGTRAGAGALGVELRGPLSLLSDEDVAELLRVSVRRSHAPDDVLIFQGERADHVHVLLQGRVSVVRTTRDGREMLIALRGPGDTLGELAALDPAPRTATVTALERVDALSVPAGAFSVFLLERPSLTHGMLQLLARRLRESDHRLVEARGDDVLIRLTRRLLELGARYGRPGEVGLDLDVPLSQEQLASWVGVSREAVSMALRTLRDREAVETGRMRITILDVDGLREIALSGG